MEALILEIQRMSTEDGPGIRSTVFLKGCPLTCTWCHNPESIARSPQIQWVGSRCIGCRLCLAACPRSALSVNGDGVAVDRDRCEGCGSCTAECPTTALEYLGTSWDVAALADELAKDRAYFESSGGGVTLSGGEPTMQPDAAEALLRALRAQGLNAALDTCGLCSWGTLERLLLHTDLLLFDLKGIHAGRHRDLTGADNARILENLRRVCETREDRDSPSVIWVRTPVIPGATADDVTIREIGAFLATLPKGAVDRWDLCGFNNLCKDKYTRLGLDWSYADTPLLTGDELDRLAAAARASGVDPEIVHH